MALGPQLPTAVNVAQDAEEDRISIIPSATADVAPYSPIQDRPLTCPPPPPAPDPIITLSAPPDATKVDVGTVAPVSLASAHTNTQPPMSPGGVPSSPHPHHVAAADPVPDISSAHPPTTSSTANAAAAAAAALLMQRTEIMPMQSPPPKPTGPIHPDRLEMSPVQSPATVYYESEPSSAWTNLSEQEDARGGVVSDNMQTVALPSINTSTTGDESGAESTTKKGFPNLAAMATSVILHRKPKVHVRLYSSADMQSVAYRHRRFGKRGFDFHLRLEGSDLIVTRRPLRKSARAQIAANTDDTGNEPTLSTIDASHRTVVNVRSEKVSIDPQRCELILHRKGRDRPLRLALRSAETTAKWEAALQRAVLCHIDSFYRLGDPLGRGAYGEVVEAFDVRTDEKRAVKIVKRGTTPKSIEHLSRELDVMRSVSHDGIVQTYQIFQGKTIYIVMEYVAGGDLFDFVASHEVLTELQGAQTMRSILSAVAYLHSSNIVHRDLKPENILCRTKTWPLETKITDFGFSTVLDPSDDHVMRTPVGTAYFMAPEIITNKGHGPPVDIWACGIILYTILTGRLPFPGRNRDEYFRNVSRGRVLFPPSLWKGISEDALNLVKGMLCMDPKKRLTALGVLHHKWITDPHDGEADKGIKRNRTNLHSKRRRLYKARSAIIAVAMAQKFKATALVDLVEKMPGGFEKMKKNTNRFAHKTADSMMNQGDKLGEGTKKLAENVGEGTKKLAENVGEGTKKLGEGVKKAGEGTKKFAEKAGEGVKKAEHKLEEGVKKSVKKTGEGIRKGAEKAADGVKKTTEGVKKGSKKAAEKIKIDKTKLEKLKMPIENFIHKFDNASHTGSQSHTGSSNGPKKETLKKKLRAFVQHHDDGGVDDGPTGRMVVELDEDGQEVGQVDNPAISTSAQAEVNFSTRGLPPLPLDEDGMPIGQGTPPIRQASTQSGTAQVAPNSTATADADGDMEEEASNRERTVSPMVVNVMAEASSHGGLFDSGGKGVVTKRDSHLSNVTDAESRPRVAADDAIEKHSSQVSNESGGGIVRPKLAPLLLALDGRDGDGTDSYEVGSSDEDGSAAAEHKLRKAAALLLMTSDVSKRSA